MIGRHSKKRRPRLATAGRSMALVIALIGLWQLFGRDVEEWGGVAEARAGASNAKHSFSTVIKPITQTKRKIYPANSDQTASPNWVDPLCRDFDTVFIHSRVSGENGEIVSGEVASITHRVLREWSEKLERKNLAFKTLDTQSVFPDKVNQILAFLHGKIVRGDSIAPDIKGHLLLLSVGIYRFKYPEPRSRPLRHFSSPFAISLNDYPEGLQDHILEIVDKVLLDCIFIDFGVQRQLFKDSPVLTPPEN